MKQKPNETNAYIHQSDKMGFGILSLLNSIVNFLDYLIPEPSYQKNSSGNIGCLNTHDYIGCLNINSYTRCLSMIGYIGCLNIYGCVECLNRVIYAVSV